MRKVLLSVIFLASVASGIFSQKTELLNFYILAGDFERINTPVSVDLSGVVKSDTLSFVLFEKAGGKLIEKPSQAETGYFPRLWFILDGVSPAGSRREYVLFSDLKSDSPSGISVDVTGDNLILKKGNSQILNYRTSILYPPAGVDSVFRRSGFVHPMYTPSGNIITRVSPPDHYHHFGIWNPWTVVRTGDHKTDFWNLGSRQGTVRYAGVNYLTEGPVYGGFEVKQDHIDFRAKDPSVPAINEQWDIRAWNTEPVNGSKVFLVDFTSVMSVASGEPIVFEAYRYGGGIGIRTTEQWHKDNSAVLTSEGKTRVDADGSRARWTDLNGAFAGAGNSGITFFSHPSNFEHPEPMRVWPLEQNGRGDLYFEFCPIRHKSWEIKPGKTYRLQYRVLVYDGKIDSATANRLWNDFAFPPKVVIINK